MVMEETIADAIENHEKSIKDLAKLREQFLHTTFACDFISESMGSLTVWTSSYPQLLEILKKIKKVVKEKHSPGSSYSSGQKMYFRYNFGTQPISINYSCPILDIPKEILGSCKIETITQTTTESVMVCEV